MARGDSMSIMQRHLRLHSEHDPNEAANAPSNSGGSPGSGRSVVGQFRRWSKRWSADQTITLLDIASGSVDVPVKVRKWAIGSGVDVRVTCVVPSGASLELGRESVRGESQREARLGEGIELQQANALKLTDTFEPRSFDYVHAGSLLRGLHEIELMTMLRIMDRLASRGIIWTGLVQSRAGFSKSDVEQCVKRLDLTYCKYSHRFLSPRFVLAGEKVR